MCLPQISENPIEERMKKKLNVGTLCSVATSDLM